MRGVIEEQTERIAAQVGGGRAICGLSGGVDSAVAAALVQRAIGSRLSCVFVDHGLLRTGEAGQVEQDFVAATGVDLTVVGASGSSWPRWPGSATPRRSGRSSAGSSSARSSRRPAGSPARRRRRRPATFLVQGTLYPDVVESGGGAASANIKSHHNVGGLPDDLAFELVEPLRTLFKDEVREVGRELGLPPEIVWRQPFPGPGAGHQDRRRGHRRAAAHRAGRRRDRPRRALRGRAGPRIWQCPVVLLADVRSVGVQGDGRSYGYPVVLRPVTSEDAMTADWARLPDPVLAAISTRITNEVPEINRVVLDVTSKPPATIEWE